MRILLPLIMCFALLQARAQLMVQPTYIKPSLDLGYLFKPTVGAEVSYVLSEPYDLFQFRITAGFFNLEARQDTFPVYGILGSGSTMELLPGYEIYKSFHIIPIGVTTEYTFLESDFSPHVGLDGFMYFLDYRYIHHIKNVIDKDETASEMGLGIVPKIGISYNMDSKFLFAAGAGKSIGFLGEDFRYFSFWKGFVSAAYFFN